MTWRDSAACLGSGVDFFDPDQTNQALMVCHSCPVTDECLREALKVGPKDDPGGVWGGHTKAERDRIRPRGRKVKPCGTYAAYVRHIKNDENPCAACTEANRIKTAMWREEARRASA